MTSDRVTGLRTPAERDAFGAATYYADVNDLADPPETAYLEALPEARAITLRRLVRGLLRGEPQGIPKPAVVDPERRELPDAAWLSSFDADALRDRIDPPKSAASVALLPFPASGSVVSAPIAAVHGYDRLRLASPVAAHSPGASERLEGPLELVPLLRREGAFHDGEQADLIAAELAESVANLALARLAGRVQRRCAGRGSSGAPLRDGGLAGADPAAALERTVTDGHPFHPSGKIRRGMSATEGLSYAPEFAASIDVRFAAVDADRALRTNLDGRSLAERLYDAFDGLADAVERAVPAGRAREEYAVIPIHPWQYYRVVRERYASLEDGVVVPVSGYSRPATPLLNLRTVVPHPTGGSDAPPHCKLAIGVQTTNVERTVSPQAVYNGPRVTDLLRSVENEADFERLGFLEEPAAACYYPPGGPHTEGEAYDDVRHLSGLVRSNPYEHHLVDDGASIVPAASLVADSPATGRSLVREAIDRYADSAGIDGAAATEGFLREYVDAVVTDQLRLLSAYGIALESHLQNGYVVFEDGRPVGTLVRDFGGIRVHHDRLADRGLAVDTYPDSDLDADGERDLYRKLYYALFQNHLAELFVAVVETGTVDPADPWRVVRDRCRETFDRLRAEEAAPPARIDRDEGALFEQPTEHKALTAMRLRGKRHEYVTSTVSNPLASPPGTERSRFEPATDRDAG